MAEDEADEVLVEGRILEWGNSFGIRLRRADLERAGLTPGTDAVIRISRRRGKVDLSHIRTFRSGRSDISERHDQYLAEGRLEELRRKRVARR